MQCRCLRTLITLASRISAGIVPPAGYDLVVDDKQVQISSQNSLFAANLILEALGRTKSIGSLHDLALRVCVFLSSSTRLGNQREKETF